MCAWLFIMSVSMEKELKIINSFAQYTTDPCIPIKNTFYSILFYKAFERNNLLKNIQ